MDVRLLTKDTKTFPIASYASAATDRTSEVIDTLGYKNCRVIVGHVVVHDSATYDIYLQHADAASDETTLTSGADVAGSSQTVGASDDNKLRIIEFEPTKRYYQVFFNKDGTNACSEYAICELYNGKSRPVALAGGTSTIGDGTATVVVEYLGAAASGTK